MKWVANQSLKSKFASHLPTMVISNGSSSERVKFFLLLVSMQRQTICLQRAEQQTSEDEHWSIIPYDAQLLPMMDFPVHLLRLFWVLTSHNKSVLVWGSHSVTWRWTKKHLLRPVITVFKMTTQTKGFFTLVFIINLFKLRGDWNQY